MSMRETEELSGFHDVPSLAFVFVRLACSNAVSDQDIQVNVRTLENAALPVHHSPIFVASRTIEVASWEVPPRHAMSATPLARVEIRATCIAGGGSVFVRNCILVQCQL